MKKTLWIAVVFLVAASTFALYVQSILPASAQEIVWNVSTTPLPSASEGHASVVYNNRIYVIGGADEHGLKAEVFFSDASPNGAITSWTATTPLPEPRTDITNAATIWNNYIYVVGGQGGGSPGERNTVWYAEIKSDGTLGSWIVTTSIPWSGRMHFARVWNGRIYVGGGAYYGTGLTDSVVYAEINSDGSLGNWIYTTSLPLAYGAMGAIVKDGKIYLIGGTSTWGGPGLSHNEVFYATINSDGSIGSWLATTPLPDRRETTGAILLGEDIYVIGGLKNPEHVLYDTVWKGTIDLDGTIKDWQSLQSLPEPTEWPGSVAFDDRIYVFGGYHNGFKDTIYYSSRVHYIPTKIDIDPDTLNLKSNGQWITAYITLPNEYNVGDIVLETVKVDGISAAWSDIQNGMYMAKFDRATVQTYLTNEPDYETAPKFYDITLTVTGRLTDGTQFEGTDTITVIKK
jgi:N-acetylneuraminic acid mutarotase